jgi:hypothetical protein
MGTSYTDFLQETLRSENALEGQFCAAQAATIAATRQASGFATSMLRTEKLLLG